MTTRIRCYTLFDITNTGVLTRRTPNNLSEEEIKKYNINRNKQCNFDTVLQVISMRSQPENITSPQVTKIKFKDFQYFGFLFDEEEQEVNVWDFEFTVNYHGVFNDGINELGALYVDCDGVPMINGLGEWDKLPNFLDINPELKNIHFEVIND